MTTTGRYLRHGGVCSVAQITGGTTVGACWRPSVGVTILALSGRDAGGVNTHDWIITDDGAAVATANFTTTNPTTVAVDVDIAADSDVSVEFDVGTPAAGNAVIFLYGQVQSPTGGTSMAGLFWGANFTTNFNFAASNGAADNAQNASDNHLANVIWGGASNSTIRALTVFGASAATDSDFRLYEDGASVLDMTVDGAGDFVSDALAIDCDSNQRFNLAVIAGTAPGLTTGWMGVVGFGDNIAAPIYVANYRRRRVA